MRLNALKKVGLLEWDKWRLDVRSTKLTKMLVDTVKDMKPKIEENLLDLI